MASGVSDNKTLTLSTASEQLTREERIFVASQWQLMWWKFRKHKMAIAGSIVLFFLYFIALFDDPDQIISAGHLGACRRTRSGFERPFFLNCFISCFAATVGSRQPLLPA